MVRVGSSWSFLNLGLLKFANVNFVGTAAVGSKCSECPVSAYSVEKVAIMLAFWADSVSPLIWEIVQDDGSKEGSSSDSVL